MATLGDTTGCRDRHCRGVRSSIGSGHQSRGCRLSSPLLKVGPLFLTLIAPKDRRFLRVRLI